MKLKLRAQKGDDTEHLKTLLKLLDELSSRPGNEWFLAALKSKYSSTAVEVHNTTTELIEVHNDLKRTKYFLKNIDRRNWKDALIFFKDVRDKQLLHGLAMDFKEMRIAEIDNNFGETARRIFLMLESVSNYFIQRENAFEIIKQNPLSYINETVDLVNGDYSFFNSDGTNKPLHKITISTKMNWLTLHYKFHYKYQTLNDLNFIRNKVSHRGSLEQKEEEKLNDLERNWNNSRHTFFEFFKNIYSKLTPYINN